MNNTGHETKGISEGTQSAEDNTNSGGHLQTNKLETEMTVKCVYLPVQSLRLEAERSSAVITFELDAVVIGGERGLSVGRCLNGGVLKREKAKEAFP